MNDSNKYNIEALAQRINDLAVNLRFNTGLQVMYTGLLMDKYVNIRTNEYGLNRAKLDVLHTLITHKGALKPSDISKMTFRSKQTVTKIVDSLIADGFVSRELEGKDRRTKMVFITEKGLESSMNNLPNTSNICHDSMPLLTNDELEQLNRILKQIRHHLLIQMANLKPEVD